LKNNIKTRVKHLRNLPMKKNINQKWSH